MPSAPSDRPHEPAARDSAHARVLRQALGAGLVALGALTACAVEAAPTVTIGNAYAGAQDLPSEVTFALCDFDPDGPVRVVHPTVAGRTGAALAVERATAILEYQDLAVVVGHNDSRETLAACDLYAARGIPLIAPEATSPRLDAVCPTTYRLLPSDAFQADAMAAFLVDHLGARKVAVFHIQDEYGLGLDERFALALAARGGEVTGSFPCPVDDDSEALVELALQRADIEAIAIMGRSPQVRGVVPHVDHRRPDLPFVISDGAALNTALDLAVGDARDRAYVMTYWHPTVDRPASKAFVDAYVERFAIVPAARDALRHDALALAIGAVRGSDGTPDGVRRFLDSLGRSRPAFDGVTGPIQFVGERPPLSCVVVHLGTDHVVP